MPTRHSNKPPITPLLEELYSSLTQQTKPQNAQSVQTCIPPRLELFARELRPGWTCIGDQVLTFQHVDLFEAI